MATPNTVVAGQNGGKRVICSPAAQEDYNKLKQAALAGQHWARLAKQQLDGLASGRIGKDNIFIRPNESRRPGSQHIDEFYIILPGCTATLERKPDDKYHIIVLEVDTRYQELQEQQQKPGMYFVKKINSQWKAEQSQDSKLFSSTGSPPTVCVSNAGYSDVETAGQLSSPEVKKCPGVDSGPFFEQNGFNLHFTPGRKKLGGLRNFRDAIAPLENEKTFESAQLLAKAMYDARKTEQVKWVSEFGGSAILTQAMKMLAQQNITLPNHTVYMVRPTTDINTAMEAALKLGVKLDRQLAQGGDLTATRSQWKAISTRRREDGDNYTFLQSAWDRFTHLKTLHGAGSAAIAGAVGAAGLVGIAAVAPGSLVPAAVTPMFAAAAKVLGGIGAGAKIADKAAATLLPKHHNKITSKFK